MFGYDLSKVVGNESFCIEFEWDSNKANTNLKKHGVSFQEAATVFGDDLSLTFPDPDHSIGESRYVTIGLSRYDHVLLISHTDRDGRTRIVSAREATRRERRFYEEGN